MFNIHRIGRGGWVSEGLEVVSNTSEVNLTTVECNSTHLTSFAVLVDVAAGLEVHIYEVHYCIQLGLFKSIRLHLYAYIILNNIYVLVGSF